MSTFEREDVLSIPAGQSYPCVKANLIHACPPDRKYKPAIYLAFRPEGGQMDTLYKVDAIFEITPHDKQAVDGLNQRYKERVQSYINQRNAESPFADQGPRKFYVLSETQQIDLPHKPKLLQNIQRHCYFKLAELTDGKEIVQVSPQKK